MRYAFLLFTIAIAPTFAMATDWLTQPSTYTHSSETGERVSQYAPIVPPTAPLPNNFRTSGYTHTRSSLNYGASADNYHRVETWGDPVRPYGEWRFPFRPFSTPYPNWGPPFAGFNLGFGFPGVGIGQGRPGYGPGYGGRPDDRPDGRNRFRRYPYSNERGFLGDGVWPTERNQFNGVLPPASPFNPYPAGPGTPYPVAPYYDGFYGNQ
ncbi:MAG: hypothetical protein AAGI63_05400 [Planctomycetota bacterium]